MSASKFKRATVVGDADEEDGKECAILVKYVLEGGNGFFASSCRCRLFSCTFTSALSTVFSVPVCALLGGQKATDEKTVARAA